MFGFSQRKNQQLVSHILDMAQDGKQTDALEAVAPNSQEFTQQHLGSVELHHHVQVVVISLMATILDFGVIMAPEMGR